MSLLALSANAQINYEDQALMYSQTELQGSARIQAIGGAQVTLGGEIGSFGINPAGIGFYRGSDIGVSLQYDNQSSTSTYFGNQTDANRGKVTLPQIGIVFGSSRRPNDGSFNQRWNNFSFGVNYNRVHNFNGRYTYEGHNPASGIGGFFADVAFEEGLGDGDATNIGEAAWDAGVVDEDQDGNLIAAGELGDLWQYRDVETKGSLSETNFTVGGNYSNRLYLGLSVGLVNVRQEYNVYHAEDDIADDAFPEIEYIDYYGDRKTTGTGFNVKAGFIYRILEDLRIGASVQTPTWLNLEDEEVHDVITNISDGYLNTFYDYEIRTPFKVNAGIAKFFSDKGYITADIEYVDYAGSEFDSDNGGLNRDINGFITERFTNAVNVRLGGEYRLENNVSLRLGYAYFGSPEKSDDDKLFDKHYFTGGLGYRYQNIYIDLTGKYHQFNTLEVPYTSSIDPEGPLADIERNRFGLMLTVGTRF